MEYSINNGSTWMDYDCSNIPAFSGNVTILMREKTDCASLTGEALTLSFTQVINDSGEADDQDYICE